MKTSGAELESELEARQRQNPESLRGVHEQVIKLIDNMVQNYLGNVRRTIQRMTNFIDNRRSSQPRKPEAGLLASAHDQIVPESAISGQFVEGFAHIRQSVLNRIQSVSKNMHDFTMQWTRAVGKQQSPLLDRIPPRGVELWRDFWDTVHKQVRRINQEFYRLSQDMSRMITGRLPVGTGPRPTDGLLHYSAPVAAAADEMSVETATQQFQRLFEKMSLELSEAQQKLDSYNRLAQGQASAAAEPQAQSGSEQNNLIDENDDEMTRNELNRNVALRQQIQQEINIFGSIFDIMRTFIQRLRESATNIVRDVVQPNSGASNNNNNDAVTPGPSVKPQVDKLLDETIESQRVINGQARPVLLPNKRVTPLSG